MRTNVNAIQVGWSAYDEVGDKLGDVAEVGRNYVLVQRGQIFPRDVYIPSSHIDSVDGRDAAVTVAVRMEDLEAQGWDRPPTDSTHPESDTTPGDEVTVPYRS